MNAIRTALFCCACACVSAIVATGATSRPEGPAATVQSQRPFRAAEDSTRLFDQHGRPDGGKLWTSHNWSGYALGSSTTKPGTYTSVTGTWRIPTVLKNAGSTSSSQWIGIDGALNGDLIQTGTYADDTNGKASYGVWWEILPASGTTIHEPVRPGQTMVASIVEDKSTKLWTITISNGSWTFVKKAHYSGKGESAEWIVEAPVVRGAEASLTRTGRVTFRDLTVNDASPKLVAGEGGRMKQGGKIVEMPSLPSATGDAFSMQYGAKAPPPPK
jgi:hypothetical protein